MHRFFFILAGLLWGCQEQTVYRDYVNLENGWPNDQKLVFNLPKITNSIDEFNVYLYLRNDDAYLYSNIFMIASLENEGVVVLRDTLEYAVAAPDGRWLGKGFLNVKESKLWWKEGFQFPAEGNYTLTLNQAMRKNAAVEGIPTLEGVVALGIELEPVQQLK